jgi:putative flippase GtrA
MSTPIDTIKKASYVRKAEPGFLEKLGVKYYHYLGKKSGTAGLRNLTIDELPADVTLQTLAGNITAFAAIIAFAIGALTTFVTIWVEWTYQESMDSTAYYLLYGSVLAIMLVIELAVLYWLGLKTVFSLACLTGHHQALDDAGLPVDDAVPNILARAALEVPDPVIHYLGIDPSKHISKSKLFLVAVLYKAKVILSSLAVKYVLIRIAGKGEMRNAFSWVGIPVTGLWDAFTLYKVAREARLRLFGHKLAEHIVSKVLTDDMIAHLSPIAREGAVRAVATMMVLAQDYHPNLLILLIRLSNTFEINESSEYDNWEDFLRLLDQVSEPERYFLLDLLSVSAAFDGQLSRMERHHLPEAFKELTDVYMQRTIQLKTMLVSGQLHAAKALCTLEFNPG